MRGEPHTSLLNRIGQIVAVLLGRAPKRAPAYAYARVRREPVDPRRQTRF